jgi:D-3-phosphoglycerate dehydrogenase
MPDFIVVHTGATAATPCAEEAAALNVPGVQFVKRGRCATPAAVAAAVADATVALCYSEPYTREVFAAAPLLKAVLRSGVGVDTIDLDAATEFGVMVGYYPDFCLPEVANHALVLMLCCAKKVVTLDRAFRRDGFAAAKALTKPMGCIHGETLGLVAFGNIARQMAERGKVLGMTVIAYDPFTPAEVFAQYGVESVSLEALAERSDYVSCHVPLMATTQGMMNAAFFARMKPTAYFINTSRGPVVNEPDLIAALTNGTIAGAGLDVFEQEPLPADSPFLTMENVVVTPHTASYADETMRVRDARMGQDALRVIRGGEPEFVANKAGLAKRGK